MKTLSVTQSPLGFEYSSFPVGPLQCNCSLIWDPKTREAILVDPGDEATAIKEVIEKNSLQVKAILHTHAHFDHIGASAVMHRDSGAPMYLHPDDKPLWDNILLQGQVFGFAVEPTIPWQTDLTDDLEITFGAFNMRTLHTPGHSPGSCSFAVGDLLLAGDTLFKGSIGRTDLWGGDFSLISKSIKERLYTLDPDTHVITGHGPSTIVGVERKSNAFVRI